MTGSLPKKKKKKKKKINVHNTSEKQQKRNESHCRKSLKFSVLNQNMFKFSWAAISMVTSPLAKPPQERSGAVFAGWREMKERRGTRWRDNQSVVREEKEREGVRADDRRGAGSRSS